MIKKRKIIQMEFEWNEEKAETSFRKHHISFDTACQVFGDPNLLVLYDKEHSLEEDRFWAIGRIGKVVVVVYTMRGEITHIISARIATKAERRVYYDACKKNGFSDD